MTRRNLTRELPAEECVSPPSSTAEETLVTDTRADLTPSQMIDRKLDSLLQNVPFLIRRPAD